MKFFMDVTLRDYQVNGINDILNAWTDCKSVLFQMPTGTGKTTLFCELVKKFTTELYPDKKVLIVTHRKELVEQAFKRLVKDFHLTSGIISANFIGDQSEAIQVASIQTLVRRIEHHEDIFSLVIIDEAHHALANTYKQLWSFYPNSKFLGVTATPIRTNGQGFQDLFDKIVISNSVKWFIKNNYLSDIKYFASHTPDVSNIKIKAGDYDETELSEVMQDTTVMADLVQSYKEFASDKKIIVFTVNRAHCTKVVEKFNSSGFTAKSIDTFTTTDERNKIVSDFINNKFKILCNVNIFTEGFDCPDVIAVQLARPTKSLTLFLQQVGRCMRPHQNKQYGIILDNAGLWKEHGLPKMERNWSLQGTDKNKIICPTEKNIIGIRENNELQESKSLRLIEIGELENLISGNEINYSKIEQNLTDKKILTMRERIEELVNEIKDLEESISAETKEFKKKIFSNELASRKKELIDLQVQLQPKRFEQVLELIIEKCQKMIDDNDIFIEGDKDIFLKSFVEPSLESSNLKTNQKNATAAEGKTEVKGLPINKREKSRIREKITVTFPDGNRICHKKVADTFVEAIKKIGPDRIKQLGISLSGIPLVSDTKDKKYTQHKVSNYWIMVQISTKDKVRTLKKINEKLNLKLDIKTSLDGSSLNYPAGLL